ncbi:LuxR C-terminal-related transcriptional regulator [Serratia fonticola]|uniref:LuxR C-terminal-related transcriptional regulator n=1 Tax=Serratia fonticola TaxID=47917 RepID=UPI00192CF2BD|nr:LuxR C-terminal-related transcriptional regulator [Serratia fonticola]MBL5825936.1 hypothetical protein [Serratia fonticola]
MNIYLLAENYFLREGVKSLIYERFNAQVKIINYSDIASIYSYDEVGCNDVFVLASSDYVTLSLALMKIKKEGGRGVLFPYDESTLIVMSILAPSIKGKVMGVDELTDLITGSERFDVPVSLSLSLREKTTLAYMLKGLSIVKIGRKMNIRDKTVYTHQRNALSKIGVRKVHHLPMAHQEILLSLCDNI